ncbi:hypothetical protein CVT24_011737, partial [Panaeolus cyanescens]
TGAVSVKARSNWSDEDPFVILLVGPTGAGKSNFIKALCDNNNDKSLEIALLNDRLQESTKIVTAYHVENTAVRYPNRNTSPVCLLDSPGVGSSSISEMEIFRQLRRWLETNGCNVNVILFFFPITSLRISGNQRRNIELIKSINGDRGGQEGTFTIVTTIWDLVIDERLQKRADNILAHFRHDLFRDMIEGGSGLTTFANTQMSALNILESCVKQSNTTDRKAATSISLGRNDLRVTPFGQQLYLDLLRRIEQAWARKGSLESDLTQTDIAQDPKVQTLLEGQLQETVHDLDTFALQLVEFGSAPDGTRGLPGDLAEYVMHKYGQQQQYAALLERLEYEWQREQAFRTTGINDDPNYKTRVKGYLRRASRQLPNLAKQLVEFGPPPDGVSGPQGDLADYVESKPWLVEDLPAAAGAKQSRGRRVFARLLLWRKQSPE